MFTRQHYKAIAAIIRPHLLVSKIREDGAQVADIALELADYFAQDNPRFDRERFLEACGL